MSSHRPMSQARRSCSAVVIAMRRFDCSSRPSSRNRVATRQPAAGRCGRFVAWRQQNPRLLDPGTDEHQEVYDRLCHFHWLIDQEVGPKNTVVQNIPWFSQWLVRFAAEWGEFLNTTDSFDDGILQSFIDYSPEYAVGDSMINGRSNAPSGWLTFNQFFARKLNPGLRPINSPAENSVVTSPADCTFKAKFDIKADSTIEEITIKKTHKFASIEDLLKDSPYKSDFAGGLFAHYFLGPYSYHRFHSPVAGKVLECRAVQGLVYLEVNLKDGQFDAPDDATGGYEFAQARGIIVIDTADSPFGDIGKVAIVPRATNSPGGSRSPRRWSGSRPRRGPCQAAARPEPRWAAGGAAPRPRRRGRARSPTRRWRRAAGPS